MAQDGKTEWHRNDDEGGDRTFREMRCAMRDGERIGLKVIANRRR